MKKLFLIAAFAALVSCTGGNYTPAQVETDSVEFVEVDSTLTDSTTVDTLIVDTVQN